MSKIERKEFQETKIMRTVSPSRHRSSTQDLAQFDSNLDNLLEDLQNSVSRPGSSLGHSTNYRESSRALESTRSNSLNRITNVKASNPVTEYSSDDAYNYTTPDGTKHVSGFKKEHYSYKTSTLPADTAQRSINQLDSLLDDLKQVKQSTESYNSTGLDPNFNENKISSSSKTVQRELHYGDTPKSSRRTIERSEREGSLTRDVQIYNEGTYGDIRQTTRTVSPSPSRSSTLSKQTKVTNVHTYPVEVVETAVPDINPEILAHLDPHLRPPGNTKVTTTIKTYTYEIPGSGNYPTNLDTSSDSERYVYSPTQGDTRASKSFIYNKAENKYEENVVTYPTQPSYSNEVYQHSSAKDVTKTYQKPTPPPGSTTVKEIVTTRNYQPGYSPERNPPGSHQTYIYNESVTTKNINENGYPPPQEKYYLKESHDTVTNVNRSPYPDDRRYPKGIIPSHETYIIKEVHNKTNTNINEPYEPDERCYPKNPPIQTYIHKEVHNTTTNKNVIPYPNGHIRTPSDAETFDPKHPPYPNSNQRPEEPININYKYVSKSKTTNKYAGGFQPSETEPLIPRPFPTDDMDGPPKKLDELMATIGHEPRDSPLNAGFIAHEEELQHQKKVEALKQQHEDEVVQKKEPIQRTKNVTGPPVYYPPGHEMFAKKEESGGWRAEGGYAKESGKYKYEAESGSKTKSRTGAAVVPVCLPLCCGLPCVIL